MKYKKITKNTERKRFIRTFKIYGRYSSSNIFTSDTTIKMRIKNISISAPVIKNKTRISRMIPTVILNVISCCLSTMNEEIITARMIKVRVILKLPGVAMRKEMMLTKNSNNPT